VRCSGCFVRGVKCVLFGIGEEEVANIFGFYFQPQNLIEEILWLLAYLTAMESENIRHKLLQSKVVEVCLVLFVNFLK